MTGYTTEAKMASYGERMVLHNYALGPTTGVIELTLTDYAQIDLDTLKDMFMMFISHKHLQAQ